MKCAAITSCSNPVIRRALRIREKHAHFRNDSFLIEGPHLLEAALSSPTVEIRQVFFTSALGAGREGQRLLRKFAKKADNYEDTGRGQAREGPVLVEVSEQIMSKLAGTETPQGIIAVAGCRLTTLREMIFGGLPLLVVCDGIQDPGNLGTIIRAADAAGADAVALLPGTCNAFSPKAVRATAGSLFNIPLFHAGIDELLDQLETRGIALCVTDVRAQVSLYEADLRVPLAIVFGNEAQGVSEAIGKKAAVRIKVPIFGRAESLNVAMAASVCLYEAARQRTLGGARD